MDIDFSRRILYLRCSFIQNLVESCNYPSSKDHVNATLHFRHCFRPKCQIAGLTCKNCSSGTWFQIAIVTTIYWWMSTNREWKTGSYNDIQVSYCTLCCCQFFYPCDIFPHISGGGIKTYVWNKLVPDHNKSLQIVHCVHKSCHILCVLFPHVLENNTSFLIDMIQLGNLYPPSCLKRKYLHGDIGSVTADKNVTTMAATTITNSTKRVFKKLQSR